MIPTVSRHAEPDARVEEKPLGPILPNHLLASAKWKEQTRRLNTRKRTCFNNEFAKEDAVETVRR